MCTAIMDYINIHTIKETEKAFFSHLLSFSELHGVTYITDHYTFIPPGTECKQLLYDTGNNAFKNRKCLRNSGDGGGLLTIWPGV